MEMLQVMNERLQLFRKQRFLFKAFYITIAEHNIASVIKNVMAVRTFLESGLNNTNPEVSINSTH